MIGWISGTLRSQRGGKLIIQTGGVGYEVLVPEPALSALGPVGGPVELFIHTHVREDALDLYGFISQTDKDFFHMLTSVSGIGPKTAITILSALPSSQLIDAILRKDLALLQRTPGIGKKTSERLVLELKDKIRNLGGVGAQSAGPALPMGDAEEVISALVNLGYKRPAAEQAVSNVDLSKLTTFDRMIKETLKLLAK